MSEPLPQIGDIVRTRLIMANYARPITTTFWWKILFWDPGVPLDAWTHDVAFRYFVALTGWVNEDWVLTCVKYRNLTRGSMTLDLVSFITGPGLLHDVGVNQQTIWTSRYGVDSLGIARTSTFPMSCLAVVTEEGRAEGDGQPPQMQEFLVSEQIFAPLFPTRWVGGFISRGNGEFVQTEKQFTNPVMKSYKNRIRKGNVKFVAPPP